MKQILLIIAIVIKVAISTSIGQTIHSNGDSRYVNAVDAKNDTIRLYVNITNDNGVDSMWARCAVDTENVTVVYYLLSDTNYDNQKSDTSYVYRFVCDSGKLNLIIL